MKIRFGYNYAIKRILPIAIIETKVETKCGNVYCNKKSKRFLNVEVILYGYNQSLYIRKNKICMTCAKQFLKEEIKKYQEFLKKTEVKSQRKAKVKECKSY